MALISLRGQFLQVNRALCELADTSEAELLARDVQSFNDPDDLERDLSLARQLVRGEIESFRLEKRYQHRDGRWVWTLLCVSLLADEGGQPLRFIAQIEDISGRKAAETKLRENQREIQMVLDNVPDLITRYDGDGRITYINRAVEAVFGRGASDFKAKTLAQVGVPDKVSGIVGHCIRQVFESGQSVVTQYDVAQHTRPGGASASSDGRHFQVRMVPERDAAGTVVSVLSVARDITALTQSQSQLLDMQRSLQESNRRLAAVNLELEKLAHIDGLTGLKNRRAFDDRLRNEIDRARRTGEAFSLVIMDIDHFKRFNDTYGHVAGDETLRSVASIAEKTLRPVDIIARYGGEEFTMILPATGREGSLTAIERCRAAIADFAWPQGEVSGSFGVATWSGEDAQTLLVRADVALYTAKKQGRNRVLHAHNLEV